MIKSGIFDVTFSGEMKETIGKEENLKRLFGLLIDRLFYVLAGWSICVSQLFCLLADWLFRLLAGMF